jgi:hypothetical protein
MGTWLEPSAHCCHRGRREWNERLAQQILRRIRDEGTIMAFDYRSACFMHGGHQPHRQPIA